MAKLLVVEDDRLLGKEITETLTDAGFDTLWAQDGDEAFEALESQDIDLLFLDIMLPGDWDGFKILKRVKGDERWMGIPVIMLTNLGQMNDIDRAMEIGALDYIVKARIDLDKLVELVKTKYLAGS